MRRPCLDCGQPIQGNRCERCTRIHNRQRRDRRPDLHTPRWRKHRATLLQAHRARHGNWCPGYQREPHQSRDLTVDHRTAVGGGGDPAGPTQVLCRSCNGLKGRHEQIGQGEGPGAPPMPR